ncbi:cupin [Chromatiales bacterium (ex Bugula neritina AB1)]|nr:cupin [Chromatiales bacterium (ex Bugula neritina AB1)]
MKAVQQNERRIANVNDAEFKPWMNDGGEDSGQSVLQLDNTRGDGVGFHVFRMAPGTTTESHQHMEDEEFFVLEGDLTDNDGTVYRPGDLVWMKKGTEHNSYSENGCTLIVYIGRAEVPVS